MTKPWEAEEAEQVFTFNTGDYKKHCRRVKDGVDRTAKQD